MENNFNLGFYRSFFENLQVAVFISNFEDDMIVDVNDEACKLIDSTKEKIIGKSLNELHPHHIVEYKLLRDKLSNNEKVNSDEFIIIDSCENCIPVEITPSIIEVENKKYIVCLLKDLRERKARENLISYYDKALEKSSIFLALVDTRYTYMTVNDSYAKTFNRSKEDIVGCKIDELFGKEYFDNVIKSKIDRALKGESIEYEANININGKSLYFQVHYEPYYSIDNKIVGVVVNLYDFTKLKEYKDENIKQEKLLIQQSKMAAMGEMLENIAHQWRQPLSLISTCTSGIKLQKDFNTLTDDMLTDSLNSIMNTTAYLSNTIDDFKNFFERDKQKFDFDLKENVDKTLELLEMSFSSNDIELIKDYDKNELMINNYKNEIMQVLLNIFNNAKDALLSNNKLEDRRLIIVTVSNIDNEISIKIQDNAGGIPENIIDKIFEPYFTTKHQSQGTGIGLFMTREIITKHIEGTISVENKEFEYEEKKHKGALFTIKI